MLADGGVQEGDRVMLCFDFGLDFLDAFLGCMRRGAVAVPVYPPNPHKLQEALQKLSLVVTNCGARHGLLDKTVNTLRATTKGWPDGVSWFVPKVSDKPHETGASERAVLDKRKEEDLAFLQYTSGSTGDPKGVMLTFGNIHMNMLLNNALEPRLLDPDAVGCSWLPQFHDMGLLAATLYPLARGRKQVFMSPTLYLKQPVLWLQAMSGFRCTWATAPNFGYGLSARKLQETPPSRRPALDLSRVVSLCNAAEPVRVETMREFMAAFGPAGLGDVRWFPSYGLAEHTVLGTTSPVSARADPTLASLCDRTGQFVACGDLPGEGEEAGGEAGVEVRIVVDGEEVPDGEVGEIWLRSRSCAQGYWGQPDLTAATFHAELTRPLRPMCGGGGYMRTGDQGFVERGGGGGVRRLFVCGRIKDLLIVRGKNIYPQDVEASAERAAGGLLRLNSSAAYQSHGRGGEDLDSAELVCEMRAGGESEVVLEELSERIAAAVRADHSLPVRRLVLIRPRTIPKTTSGKIRRKETRVQVYAGSLATKALFDWHDLTLTPGPNHSLKHAAAPDGGSGEHRDSSDEESHDGPGLDVPVTEEGFVRVTAEEVARAVGVEVDELETEQPVASIGLESLAVASLLHSLSGRLGVEVGPELVFEAESVTALGKALYAEFTRTTEPPRQSVCSEGTESPVHTNKPRPHVTAASFKASSAFSKSLIARTTQLEAGGGSGRAGPGAVGVVCRCGVHAGAVCMVLVGFYLCALPPLALFFTITDAPIFPFVLFRDLAHPAPFAPVQFRSWGDGNGLGVSDFPLPASPLLAGNWFGLPVAMASTAAAFVVTVTTYTVLLKWVLLGRVREGKYELWGWFYWRRWLVQRHLQVLEQLLAPLVQDAAPLSVLYCLLGGRVGVCADAVVRVSEVDLDLVSVGERARVSGAAAVVTAVVAEGFLHLRSVRIGAGCVVDDGAVLCPGVCLPRCTRVAAKAVVTPASIQSHCEASTLAGNPAVIVGEAPAQGNAGSAWWERWVRPVTWLACLLAVCMLSLLPVVAVYHQHLQGVELTGLAMPAAALGLWALFWAAFALLTLAFKHAAYALFLPAPTPPAPPDPEVAAPKTHKLRGGRRVSSVSGLLARECAHRLNALVSRFVLAYLWGGSGIVWWYRAMGARIGAGTTFSMGVTLSDWDAVQVGEAVLLGGGCTLECSEVDEETGARVVLGVTLEEGVALGANSHIGPGSLVSARALVTARAHVPSHSEVPAHAVVVGGSTKRSARACFVPRQGLPPDPPMLRELTVWAIHAAWTILAVWTGVYLVWLLRVYGSLPGVLLCPLGGGVYLLLQLLLLVLCKNTVARRPYCDEELVLHSVGDWWRSYALLYLWHIHEGSLFGHCLRGGPLANLLLRTMRGRVDMDAFIDSLYIYDMEQIEIAAGAAINANAVLSPHVIRSRASARLHRIRIAGGASVWPGATCIGSSVVPPRTQVGPASRMTMSAAALAMEELERAGGEAPPRMLAGVPAALFVDTCLH